jgi:hypothetical protein
MASTCSSVTDAALQVEGAVMSLSPWEQQVLDFIGNGLAQSDPELATLLTTFDQLTSGEEMPTAESISAVSLRSLRRPLRRHRRSHRHGLSRCLSRVRRRLSLRWMALTLWLVITVGLVTMALCLSGGAGGGATCAGPWGTACMAPVSHPAAGTADVSHTPAPGTVLTPRASGYPGQP